LYVKFSNPSCIGFLDIVRKADRQTAVKNITPANADGVGKNAV